MDFILQRTLIIGQNTEGRLYLDGKLFCYTLENSFSSLPAGSYILTMSKCHYYDCQVVKIQPHSSIAARHPGVTDPRSHLAIDATVLRQAIATSQAGPQPSTKKHYTSCRGCEAPECVSFNTLLSRYCPMFKPGNGVHDRTDGSIRVGIRASLGLLVHTKAAYQDLCEAVQCCQERQLPVTLVIRNP